MYEVNFIFIPLRSGAIIASIWGGKKLRDKKKKKKQKK